MNRARRRTIISFSVLILFFVGFAWSWSIISKRPRGKYIAPTFAKVHELNGELWQALFRPSTKSIFRPPTDKKPRTNGKIGLSQPADPATWKLHIIEDDKDPQAQRITVNIKDIRALPRSDASTEFRCIEGWSEDISYSGVKFSDFVRAYNLKLKRYVGLVTVDGKYYVSIDMESMMHEQTILSYEMNGRDLLPENGAPLRLVIPIKYGIKSLKQIGKIFFSDERPPDYWHERGYDWYAGL